MSGYSLRKNLEYVALAFTHPSRLIDGMRQETSIGYGLVPFLVEKALYEIAFLLDHYLGRSTALVQETPLLGNEYLRYKPFLAPALEVVDVFLFAGVMMGLAKAFRHQAFDIIKVMSFFLFLATFGILAFVADMVYAYGSPQPALMWIHPLVGLLALVYLTEYVSRQAKMTRLMVFALVLPALTVYFAFRILFFM